MHGEYATITDAAARVAGDVDAGVIALGVEPHAAVGELVLQVADRDLVARDDPRAKDHVVALPQFDVRVAAFCDARQGRAGDGNRAGAVRAPVAARVHVAPPSLPAAPGA